MTDRDAAREAIADLVQRFTQAKAQNRLATYNEDQTRHYYILPLFRALGWDTSNPAEFTAEEHISRGYVDFGFYLNDVPVFYLETKRVTERLSKPENMRQSINYAYLRGVTWAVLTDFEELMVFNADWEERDPLKARFLSLKAESYATDGFEDLWLLSKAAMSQSPRAIDVIAFN